MKIQKLIAGLACLLAVCLSAAACKGKNPETPPEPGAPIQVEAIAEEDCTDYTADAALTARIASLRASFAEPQVTPVEDFWFRTEATHVVLVAYMGESKRVWIPERVNGLPVTEIADEAFAGRETVESLYLPDSITKIGASVLSDCQALQALRTPLLGASAESTQYLGYLFGAESYENNSRDVPASLTYLEIGGSAEALADFALFDCNDLLCIQLPASMTELGKFALYNCTQLITLNTEQLRVIGNNAFDSCTALTRMEFGTGLQSIGSGALENCNSLRRLTLPFVGGSATENRYLAYLFGATTPEHARGFYPSRLVEVNLLQTATTLDSYAFFACESLTKISLPDTLTKIGLRAFDGCVRLQSLALPASLCEISAEAFRGCYSLVSLSFAADSRLTAIGINAFYSCHALESVTLPTALTALPASCFADCFSLVSIDLGGVQAVGKNAFRRCQSLTEGKASAELMLADGNEALRAAIEAQT